jgi:ABC-type uncharacterized transport system involved in gliding motility auxiliary subunit
MRLRFWCALAGVLGVLGIVVGINLFADARLPRTQLDLTQGHIYTLSKGTRRILASLKEPITLRLFYSRALGAAAPSYGAYADHVKEILGEYAAASHGKLIVETYNPVPFSATEDRAIADGLQGVPLNTTGEKVYFGLAGTNLLDDQRTVPFFQADRERFLEYDLTKLIYELSNPARSIVGVMSSLPIDGNPQLMMMAMQRGLPPGSMGQPYAVSILLRQTNDIRSVPMDTTGIDPAIKVLLLIGPQHLSEATQYAIDQFVMRGGHLMVMVDPWSDTQADTPSPNGMPPTDTSSDLPKLFKAWGIQYNPNEVAGELDGAWEVQTQNGSPTDYPAWYTITKGVNHDDPATASIKNVSVATPGWISKAPGASITLTPLLTADGASGPIAANRVKTPDPAAVLAAFKPQGGPRVIAARVTGELHSGFSGPPPAAKGKPPLPYLSHTKEPAQIVVVADTDILADRFWIQKQNFFGQSEEIPISDNGPFVANVVDTLAGSNALLGLRARGTTARPFTLIDQMQEQAEAKFQQSEQALQAHLVELQKRLDTLRQGTGQQSALITPAQRAAIRQANEEILATRAQLRAVQFNLNRDISRLKTELVVLNVAAIPALLTLLAIAMGLTRAYRRSRVRA